MKSPVFIIATLMLLAVASSCTKTNTAVVSSTATAGKYTSMTEIFTLLAVPVKPAITINADSGGSFYGNSGTRYIFKPSSFVTAAGGNVSGNVQIVVSEILKKGDMIFTQVLPVCNGQPLFSGGEVYATASQNGQQIFLKPSYTFQANVPLSGVFDSTTTFFSGQTVTGNVSNTVNWVYDSIPTGYVIYSGDTISIISDSLQWCNADRFMTKPNYQTFTVTIAATNTTVSAADNLMTYVMYDNHKGVWPLSSLNGTVYSEHHVPNIPVHIVSFALINGHFFGGVTGVTPANNANYTLTLTEVDPVAFKGQLNELYP